MNRLKWALDRDGHRLGFLQAKRTNTNEERRRYGQIISLHRLPYWRHPHLLGTHGTETEDPTPTP